MKFSFVLVPASGSHYVIVLSVVLVGHPGKLARRVAHAYVCDFEWIRLSNSNVMTTGNVPLRDLPALSD